jgi:hypothetical protein
MFICLFMAEIFCSAATVAGSIYSDGFDMYISYDRPDGIVWGIDSTPNHDAAFVTSSTYLSDGKVSVPTRFTWDTGSLDHNFLVQFIATLDWTASGSTAVVAVLCPKTQYAIPEGVKVKGFFSVGATSVIVSSTVKTFNNGATGVVFLVNLSTLPAGAITQFGLDVYNDIAGFTWATAGQTVDIGEIWFGTLQEFKNTPDPQIALIDPTQNRRSHNNTPQPLFGKPYRTLTASLPPISDSTAYYGTQNWDYVRNQIVRAQAVLAIPRVYVRGSSSTQDSNAINQLSIFGRPEAQGPLTGVRNMAGYWNVPNIVVSEAPP